MSEGAMHREGAVKAHFLKSLNLKDVLHEEAEIGVSGVKVVATIGPACHEVDQLAELLDAGAVGARFDLTWGPLEFHRQSLANLQVAMQTSRKLCCTVVDTLGRELMIRRQIHRIDDHGWPVHDESWSVEAGQKVTITTRPDALASQNVLPITYERFTEMAEAGDTIYVGRYLVCGADAASLYLEVLEVKGPDVICVAKNNAVLEGLLTVFHTERSVNTLQNVQNALPLLSDYDKEAIQSLAHDFEIDFISLSYTRNEEDVHEARAWLSSIGCSSTRVLAKVETRQSLLNFDGILSAADGIVISRGNLGLDCAPEKMALIQKQLIQACNLVGKPCLITRVVDTMVDVPRPTRAEATDVANAVLDGVDGIVLGAETLRGKFPANTVRTISRICRSAEKVYDFQHHYDFLMEHALEDEEARAMQPLGGPNNSAGQILDAATAIGPGSATDASNGDLVEAGRSGGSGSRTTPTFLMKGFAASQANIPNMSAVALSNKPPNGSSSTNLMGMHGRQAAHGPWRSPYLSKLESIASSAVRVADKVAASLMVVYTHSGATAALVAKYKPPVPILTIVVPQLVSDGLKWQMQGRGYARQSLLTRGLLPMLANPSAEGEESLNEAVAFASSLGIIKPHDHIVCVQRTRNDFGVKVLSVDHCGFAVKKIPKASDAFARKSTALQGAPFASSPSMMPGRADSLAFTGLVP